jgi:hypothetical protein
MPKLERRKETDSKAIGNLRLVTAAAAIVLSVGGKFAAAQAYQQINLVSDIQGLASNPPNGQADTQLLNPWGIVASPRSYGRFGYGELSVIARRVAFRREPLG